MKFKCLKNCGECCETIPIRKDFYESKKDFAQRDHTILVIDGTEYVIPVANDFKWSKYCIFLTEDRCCSIYEDRMDVCRIYGYDGLNCPYIKQDGTKRTEEEAKVVKDGKAIPYATALSLIYNPENKYDFLGYLCRSLLSDRHPLGLYIAMVNYNLDVTEHIVDNKISVPEKSVDELNRALNMFGVSVVNYEE